MQRYVEKQTKKDNVVAKTTLQLPENIINEKTKIIKKDVYTKAGYFSLEEIIVPNEELLGANKEYAENYFRRQGYNVEYFTSERVVISKNIDNTWPPNVFIALANEGKVYIYQTDEYGNLKLKEETEINIESLPQQEQEDLKRGVIKRTYEEMEDFILEDLDS
ncbi:BofC C-terminal domain-containing protein [Caloramator sp. mosi_1]|uniref:BofC C-terminal domain-containing protein n=1 Tax=Caloramator sp. mosi_1 TaxID=3023090 RepID=UPI0023619A33|nr:BofC C-terminal domain-containing protein [Caloramator sp. mosi_1]WDC83647.1 BofC C-terminal domain-containing protein [Caloramator sp. mosi_1]